VIPQVLVGVGLVMLAVGAGILRSFGPRYRVGRLLASTAPVTLGEAVELAHAGERRLVRVQGRIDSDEDFEDANHQPLVLRRTRLEHGVGLGRWRTLDLRVEAVPFELHEDLDAIGVDTAALGDGLVVVPRRSVGAVSDLGDRVPTSGVRADAPARLTVEQVSSVEHAIAVGVPILDPAGRPTLTAGGGRPLILTTLEIPEAMRVLTGGAVARSRAAVACLLGGGSLVVVGIVAWIVASLAAPVAALAASPDASILPGSDTRSAGQGPGLVGNPAFAILGVLAVALAAVVLTLLYVRITRPRTTPEVPPGPPR
jgi:hypothetical protein